MSFQNSQYNFSKNGQRYQESIPRKDIKTEFHNTEYHVLIHTDQFQYGKYSQISIRQNQYILKQMLKDLQFLLYVNQEQFWNHLKIQEELFQSDSTTLAELSSKETAKVRLRICLESCLNIFTRKSYLNYNLKTDQNFYRSLINVPQFWFTVWCEIKKVVLFIFYRICQGKTQTQQEIRFNNWYIDTCKFMDLCLIYGETNPEIVKKMANNLYSQIQYQQDFRNVLELIITRLKDICNELQICHFDFDSFQLKGQTDERFCQPYQILTDALMSLLFKVRDVLLNIQTIFNYFSIKCKLQLIGETLIFKLLIMINCKIRQSFEFKWKLRQMTKKYHTFVTLIRENTTVILTKCMENIHSLLNQTNGILKQDNELKNIKRTYINICLMVNSYPLVFFKDRNNVQLTQVYLKYQKQLALTMLLTDKQKVLFSNSKTISYFQRNHQNFKFISQMALFEKEKKKQFLQIEKLIFFQSIWKLKTLEQFQNRLIAEKQLKTLQQVQKRRKKQKQQQYFQTLIQYNDEPQFINQPQNQNQYSLYSIQSYLEEPSQTDLQNFTGLKTLKLSTSNDSKEIQKQFSDKDFTMNQLSISVIKLNESFTLSGHPISLNQQQSNSSHSGLTKTQFLSSSIHISHSNQE